MITRMCKLAVAAIVVGCGAFFAADAPAQELGQPTDWQRFYHYPYVYYPHNFQAPQEFDSLYWRYPQERRIPVYRDDWYNFYPNRRAYHSGHAFLLDVF
ncbi:MAG: hypothetical protein AAF532_06620 [Planctomycetota bacterium]